ncbi:SAM-dependent DNA methyltransferase, partial [Candidatus Nomurabacteria bacterium]|nr:SAM-dependent DNA methyltransferase [Candidatus Nomurabacteria bacterium]
MSLGSNISEKANLIWAIADKLTGTYKPHEYGEVVLPLTVIRRFDCILVDKKAAVLAEYEKQKSLPNPDPILRIVAGYDFYNTSKFTMKTLLDDPDNIEANFRNYLNGFSKNVQEIIEKFRFDAHITMMATKGILYNVLKEFTTEKANLHPDHISNLEMGYIFEELVRKFSEAHNEDAGQHYTPREVIELMTHLVFDPIKDQLPLTMTIYDPACGSGGMLTESQNFILDPEGNICSNSDVILYGKEINDETYAICKSDMMIKGNNPENIKNGSTLSVDDFAGVKFDFMLSNPPFGTSWKSELKAWGDIKKADITDPRFVIEYADTPEYSLIPD